LEFLLDKLTSIIQNTVSLSNTTTDRVQILVEFLLRCAIVRAGDGDRNEDEHEPEEHHSVQIIETLQEVFNEIIAIDMQSRTFVVQTQYSSLKTIFEADCAGTVNRMQKVS